jgi:WD40 repeat protein
VLVAVVGVAAMYLASTWGWAALRGSSAGTTGGVGTLPAVVERPPPSVSTTGDYGPAGSVSMVFAGTHVRDGLLGSLDPVWVTVSSQTGDYRALEVEDLPEPAAGAMSVSPAGDRLAWVGPSGVVVYDTVSDESVVHEVPDATAVGAFSPDGALLLTQADGLAVMDVATGDVVAEFDAEPDAVRRTAWRPDGSAVDFVAGNELVTGSVPGSEVSSQPTDIPERSQIVWSGSGERLASLQPQGGGRRLYVAEVSGDGLTTSRPVPTPQTSLQRLVGFSSDDNVTVIAYRLESGAVERMLDVPLGAGSVVDVTTLPDSGENWVGSRTLAIATDTLPFGSTDFDDRIWPWSYTSRLVMCIVAGVFFLGLFVTRRPR